MEVVRDISQELKSSYIDYAMSVIVGRAIPDVRDGLKPVQRRILYTMHEMGLHHNRPHKKCARIVGSCLGNYHPHGDAPVYEALVRLAQDFVMRYPLVDGQGNFGSIDGDSPAAMRYTEARLTKIAEEMLVDIDKDTVDFVPNFDATLKEPVVLPSKIPNLLINGSMGIAVGMATNIPPHNLSEVCDAIKAYINNPSISVDEIMSIIKGPDFPTGGVVNKSELLKVYSTGRGRITVRGTVEFENGSIVIKEIPYTVNKAKLVERIAELIKNGKLDEAKTVRDESDREGLRVVVELKGDPNSALDKLYKFTSLQINLNVTFLALVNGEPRILNIKGLIEEFVNHRRTVTRRKVKYELEKSKERLHIVEGLKIALENIDDVISIIKSSKTPEMAKKRLIEKYGFSKLQADAILRTRLQKLTTMEIKSLIKEYNDLTKKIAQLQQILEDPKKIDQMIINEMDEIKNNYSDERRTKIVHSSDDARKLERKSELVILTSDGHLKKMESNQFLRLIEISTEKILVELIAQCFSNQKLIIFTSKGRAFGIDLKDVSKKIVNIFDLFKLENDEKIISIIPTSDFSEDVLILTKDGYIKSVNLSEFKFTKKAGIIASPSEIVSVKVKTGDEVGIATRNGYFVRFKMSDVPKYGRQAKGVKAIKLRDDDKISWMTCMEKDGEIVVATRNGYIKRVKKDEFRLTNRGSMGVICARGHRIGDVIFAEFVKGDEKILIITKKSNYKLLNVNDIPLLGRNKAGERTTKDEINCVFTFSY